MMKPKTKRQEEYFEFDLEAMIANTPNSAEEIFYLKDLKQRKLFLNTEIDQFSIHEITRYILQFNKDDMDIPVEERKPIILYVVTGGGSVTDGFELIDVIMCSKTPVYTVNLGYWYSMGLPIGIAGHKRFGMATSSYLIHDGYCGAFDSSTKMQDRMEFNKRIDDKVKNIIVGKTKITGEEYDSKLRVEWYMFAEEAKEKGIIDYIVGIDCEIDKII